MTRSNRSTVIATDGNLSAIISENIALSQYFILFYFSYQISLQQAILMFQN